MSCDYFQHKVPPERTLQLYRGLVRDGDNNFNSSLYAFRNNDERERLRVLEILGLTDDANYNCKSNKHNLTTRQQRVDKPSYHLGSFARKRNSTKDQFQSKTGHQIQATKQPKKPFQVKKHRKFFQADERKQESKKTPRTASKLNPRQNKEYIWHPLYAENRMQKNKSTRKRKDVLSHYHNQYHKQK